MRYAKAPLVAESLGISGTTLRRRLQEDGKTFQELLDAERIRRTQAAMTDNRETRGEHLMKVCGYGEVNSFYRAFARWHGVNFQDYRRELI